MQAADTAPIPRGRNFLHGAVLGIAIAALGSAFIAVSQGPYYYGDEGFHLLASQLLITGKRLYLDFFFQHPPVYPYLNAGWMRLVGNTWRSAHLFSALLAIICAAMIGGYLFSRFDRRDGRLVCALGGVLFFMLNPLVVRYAVLGQPYALCLVWLFGAFLLAIRAAYQPRFSAVWAGLFCGAAVATSLLTSIVPPVLFYWILRHTERPQRRKRLLQFAGGIGLGLLPLWIFALRAPRQFWFDVVFYHLKYRQQHVFQGESMLGHELKTLTGWIDSSQGLLLFVLSLIAVIFFAVGKGKLENRLGMESRLSALILICLAPFLCVPRLSQPQYFVLLIPFLSILAASGLYVISHEVGAGKLSIWLAVAILGLYAAPGAKVARRQMRDSPTTWTERQEIADLIDSAIPQDCPIFSDDGAIYFVTKRLPPSGLENNYSLLFEVPKPLAELLHAVPEREMNSRVLRGEFAAVVAWSPAQAESLGLKQLFNNHKAFPEHVVFWNWAGPSPPPCQRTSNKR